LIHKRKITKRVIKKRIPERRVETNSPIEEKFYELSQKIKLPLLRQYKVGNYFIDFAYIDPNGFGFKLAVELDGQKYHSSYAQRKKDYERERYLMKQGWIVIRFTGSEINRNCEKCANELIDMIEFYNSKLRIYG